jgi:hypothetical protein
MEYVAGVDLGKLIESAPACDAIGPGRSYDFIGCFELSAWPDETWRACEGAAALTSAPGRWRGAAPW